MPAAIDHATVTVRLLVFGAARDAVGFDETQLQLKAPCSAQDARTQLLERYPALARFGKSLLLAVNQEYTTPNRQISDGDELALFPPVSGGSKPGSAGIRPRTSNQDFFELTTEPIDVGAVVNGPNSAGIFRGGLGGYQSGMVRCPPGGGSPYRPFDGRGSRYVDDVRSWQTDEPALDMTGAAILAAAVQLGRRR